MSEFVRRVPLPCDGAGQEDAEDDEHADPEHEAGQDGDLPHEHLMSLRGLRPRTDLESEQVGPGEVDPEMRISEASTPQSSLSPPVLLLLDGAADRLVVVGELRSVPRHGAAGVGVAPVVEDRSILNEADLELY